ncbi:MAG: hypothetical protein ACRDOI_07965 [Trebonia sp.]
MPHATQVSLCVEVAPSQASSEVGHPAQWTVSVWTMNGNVPDATLRLQATPVSGGAPGFSFGCGNDDGTSSCDLGAVDAKSAKRQFQAQLTVPVTASDVTSVSLTAIGSAPQLTTDPEASAVISITAPSAAAPQNPPAAAAAAPVPTMATAPLPIGGLPSIPAASPTLSPLSQGGNAADLFPTLNPKPKPKPTPSPAQSGQEASTRSIANTSALPAGAPIVGAQLAGLAALALGFVLAVTRLSIRRRPTPDQPTAETPRTTEQETPDTGPLSDGE